MIVTVTANPSLDRAVQVGGLRRGEVQRAVTTAVDAGGKGINVSRALAAHGHSTRAVLCTGGFAGVELLALLAETTVPLIEVPVIGGVRSNLTLVEPDGIVTKLNEPGPRLSAAEVDAVLDAATEAIGDGAGWVAGCGSLPPGMPVDFYARLTERAHAAGTLAAIDTSGAALEACLAARPDLVKPNADELAESTGAEIRTLGDAVKAAQALLDRGAGAVLASLGADGALLVDLGGAWHATARPATAVLSTVGAGDAALAGFLANGANPEALLAAVTWGTAAATLPGSSMPGPNDLDRAPAEEHRPPDPDRVLTT